MAKNPIIICLLSDTHGLYDDRIYWKEAISLKKAGYEVWHIFVGDKKENGTTKEGIHFIGLPQKTFSKKRIANYLLKKISPGNLHKDILEEAAKVEADVYHLHDLKINRIGKKLKQLPWKPKVIYDIHEPHYENILDYYETNGITTFLKNIYARYIRWWEMKKSKNYDFIIATEENVRDRFRQHLPADKVDIVYNYTNLQDARQNLDFRQKEYDAIYCGGITKFRGAWQILEAAKIAKEKREDLKVLFLGTWVPFELKGRMLEFIRENDLTNNIVFHESVPYAQVSDFYNKSRIGLGIFLPIKTHRIILQIKIFEYMNFGLPIIGSNFGHINNYIENDNAGISVNPENPLEIADAFTKLLTDKDLYQQCSMNGVKAVDDKYNWELMEKKLLGIYGKLVK
jgi:glycosyltransferase involved in cell wall biosynthesis